MYSMLLLGFPIGIGISLAFWYIKKKFPGQSWMRQVHPVVMLSGATHWAPYNVGYIWPAVPIALLSWSYVRKRWMGLWSKVSPSPIDVPVPVNWAGQRQTKQQLWKLTLCPPSHAVQLPSVGLPVSRHRHLGSGHLLRHPVARYRTQLVGQHCLVPGLRGQA